MERKATIFGGVAVAALAVGLILFFSRGNDGSRDGVARIDAQSGRLANGTSGSRATVVGVEGGALRPDRAASGVGDGGVPVRPVLPTPTRPIEANRTAPALGRDTPRSAAAAQQSAGWRLGQTRRLIEIIEPRIASLRQVQATLEQRGDPTAVEQQRAVVQRFETRLADLREEETSLEADARRDGTLGEVERGYQETDAAETRRAPARETAEGAIER